MTQLSNKKITVVSIFYPPEIGAAPSRIYKLVESLSQQGADVEVITALPNYPNGTIFDNYRGKFYTKDYLNNITVHRYWLYPSNSKNAILRIISMFSFSVSILFSLWSLLRRRPDVIIVNSPPLLTGFSAVILGNLCRAKVLLNVSDLWPLSALELGAIKKGLFYKFLEIVEKAMYHGSTAIMAQSQESLQHIMQITKPKPFFLYRNLDKTSLYVNKIPLHEYEKIKIVYAGLLGVAQGVLEICRQVDFQKLKVEFHIYGAGNERSAIQDFINQNPEYPISLHDTVSKEEITRIIADFHATIVPLRTSIYGAFPSKIFMAIASGLPVLLSGEGEGAEFVLENRIGWVSGVEDYTMLSENIKKLCTMQPNEYKELREHCIKASTIIYNQETQEQKLFEFIAGI